MQLVGRVATSKWCAGSLAGRDPMFVRNDGRMYVEGQLYVRQYLIGMRRREWTGEQERKRARPIDERLLLGGEGGSAGWSKRMWLNAVSMLEWG